MNSKRPYTKPALVRHKKLADITAVAPISAVKSDRRLKTDVQALDKADNGIQLYAFRYVWSDQRYAGVMAQDLLSHPIYKDAVTVGADGFYEVDYSKLGLRMAVLNS